ncbi:MAG: DMT family transporter, partial [Leptospira sp.]|nr:DMT family transporter [Leptospira sp.]
EKLTPKLGSVLFASLALSISSIAVFIHFALTNKISDLVLPERVYYLGIAMAIVSTVIPVFFAAEGIRLIGSGRAAIAGSIGPISTIFLGYIFLNENISVNQGIGTVLVLAGVMIISVKKKTI